MSYLDLCARVARQQQQAGRRRQWNAKGGAVAASESAEQQALIQIIRAHANHPEYGVINTHLAASANGADLQRVQNKETGEWFSPNAQKLLKEGMAPGFPDLFLYLPAGVYHGLAIEMKSAKGRLQDNQIMWRDRLEGAGYGWRLCRSANSAWDVLKHYVDGVFDMKEG